MDFIKSIDPKEGEKAFIEKLKSFLVKNEKVLWFIPGGSNIPTSVEVMKNLRAVLPMESLANLTVTLTDERYGPTLHKDSNWKQLIDAGFDFTGITTIPVLANLELQETTKNWMINIQKALNINDRIIGQFGVGPDGHIAGMLPHSSAVTELTLTTSYEAPPFTRITLTALAIKKIRFAYVFAFGLTKQIPIQNLQKGNIQVEDEPAQVLKFLGEVHVYSDQIK